MRSALGSWWSTAGVVLMLAACSSSDDAGQSGEPEEAGVSVGVLEGAETGLARGSTEEVPFDPSAADRGRQSAPDTPAVVQVPSSDGRQTITARVTITSAGAGVVDDLRVEGVPDDQVEEVDTFFVGFRMEYVSGPVLRDFESVFLGLTSGNDVVSDDNAEFSGVLDGCGLEYTVDSFGEGAILEGCVVILVPPDQPPPDGVAWTAEVDGASGPPVVWPLG